MTMTMTKKNELFGYEETDKGRLEFFSTICHELEDFLTKPLDVYQEVMSESERIDFIKNKLEDAYNAEVDYRHEETNQECLYDINHLACFTIKNTETNRSLLEDEDSGVYSFDVWDDSDSIFISLIGEWDVWVLSRDAYSERMIENFCAQSGVDENDVLDKTVTIQG